MTLAVSLPTRRTTTQLARRLAQVLEASDLVLFDGPLGAGKTFLVRALLRALGVPFERRVASPTFGLVHEYELESGLVVLHADLYRLAGKPEEVAALGLRERRNEGAMLLVEWGNEHVQWLGPAALVVELRREPERSARVQGPKATHLSP